MTISRLPKGNAAYINRLNKIKVLRVIRERNEISRADIVREVGLSAPTVTRIVDSLIKDDNLALEVGIGSSEGGRPPILVRFNSQENYVIGIDLGAAFIRGAVSNLNAQIIAESRIPTQIESGPQGVIARVADLISDLLADSTIERERILGIGLAVSGLIDQPKNIGEFSFDFNWRNVDIETPLGERFDIPVICDNVTRVMALGELWYGIGSSVRNLICVNLGYGIGAGIILDGKPLYGTDGMAGEFGHITVDKDSGVECLCGNTGCLEALASGRGIALAARRRLANGETSILRDTCGGNVETVTAEMVVDAAKRGDPLAVDLFETAVEYIGIGIAALINLFDPQAVVVGGGISRAGDVLFDRLRETVQKRIMLRNTRRVRIVPVKHGSNAAVMGAIALVLNEILNFNLTGNVLDD